jgi:hypothetical protein
MTEEIGGGRPTGDQEITCKSKYSVEECLWPKDLTRNTWMIVDAARDRRLYGLVLDCFYSRHTCLFAGALTPEIQVVAPYLLQLECDDPKTNRLIRYAWGNNWGVFLHCDTRLETLKRHLRTLLTVRDERGNRLLFRYYDPRVLRIYLPTCTTEELKTIFGPIDCFSMEEELPDTLLEFRFDQRKLITARMPVNPSRYLGQANRTQS